MTHLHRPTDDADPGHYPLRKIVIELQAPRAAHIDDMLADLDEIVLRLRHGERDFAGEALLGYRVRVGESDTDMFRTDWWTQR